MSLTEYQTTCFEGDCKEIVKLFFFICINECELNSIKKLIDSLIQTQLEPGLLYPLTSFRELMS